jgi:hypothetical protein
LKEWTEGKEAVSVAGRRRGECGRIVTDNYEGDPLIIL